MLRMASNPNILHRLELALLWTLEQGLGPNWNEETKAAWIACYTILSSAMIDTIDKAGIKLHNRAELYIVCYFRNVLRRPWQDTFALPDLRGPG
jgi:hypothetical protein